MGIKKLTQFDPETEIKILKQSVNMDIKLLEQSVNMNIKLLEDVCKAMVDLDQRLRYLERKLGVENDRDKENR